MKQILSLPYVVGVATSDIKSGEPMIKHPQLTPLNIMSVSVSYQGVAANDSPDERDFHGAALVDSFGREIPLTTEMVDRVLLTVEDYRIPATHSSGKTGT